MDGYFARLAQRSEIAPATAVPRTPANAPHNDSDGLERHVEVIVAPMDAAGTASITLEPSAPQTTPPPLRSAAAPASSTDMPSESRPPVTTALPDDGTPVQHGLDTVPSAPDAAPAHSAKAVSPASVADAQPDLRQASPADSTPTGTAPGAAYPHTSPSKPKMPIPATTARPPSRDPWTMDALTEASLQSTDSAASSAHTATAHAARSGQAGSEARGDIDMRPPAPAATRARPLPAARDTASRPAATQAATAPQVHIGRIELEVRQSAPIPPAAAAPAEPVSAPPRSAAFNPHRHYLRGA